MCASGVCSREKERGENRWREKREKKEIDESRGRAENSPMRGMMVMARFESRTVLLIHKTFRMFATANIPLFCALVDTHTHTHTYTHVHTYKHAHKMLVRD
jgi:hypothetical protein